MQLKGSILIILAISQFLFFSSCATLGNRISMDEFKKQLEDSKEMTEEEQQKAIDEAAAAQAKLQKEQAQAATPVPEATEAPAIKPTKAPTTAFVKIKPVSTPVTSAVKKTNIAATPAAIKKAPVEQAQRPEGDAFKWILVAVFAAAFAIFALVAFILAKRKRDKDEEKEEVPLPEPGIQPAVNVPETAVEEYKKSEQAVQIEQVEKTTEPVPPKTEISPPAETLTSQAPELAPIAETPSSQAETPPPQPAEPAPRPEAAHEVEGRVEDEGKEQESENEQAAKEAFAQPDSVFAKASVSAKASADMSAGVLAGKTADAMPGQYGEGMAGISPTQFAAGSQGNAVHLLYKVGGDSPEFRTIKITVPEGWSKPSTLNTDEGYFTAAVNTGNIISTSAEDGIMLITVQGLPAEKGEVAVTYGERRGGSAGVKVQAQPGEAVFKVETEARGSTELKEIEDSPVVDVN